MNLTSLHKSILLDFAMRGGSLRVCELLPVEELYLVGFVDAGYVSIIDDCLYKLTNKGWKEVLHFVDPTQISQLYTYLCRIRAKKI